MLSPELKRLLHDDTEADPIGTIAGYMALREEARAALPVLKAAATQPAGEPGVAEVIGRRFALFPQPDRSDAEWDAWWADYYETLSHVSWSGLEAAMAAYVADPSSEFMPKPGKLLELSRLTPNKSVRAYERARRAIAYAEPATQALPAPDFRPEPTAEEKAQVRSMLADFNVKFAGKTMDQPAKSDLPSIAGKPDETGITPQMRAVLQRQRGEE